MLNSRFLVIAAMSFAGGAAAQQPLSAVPEFSLNQFGVGKVSVEQMLSGVNLAVLETPPKGEQKEPTRAIYVLKDGLLVTTDNLEVATGILDRLAGVARESLAGLAPYQAVMQRCQSAAGERPKMPIRSDCSVAGGSASKSSGPLKPLSSGRFSVNTIAYVERM